MKKTGAASDAFQYEFNRLKAIGGHAACGAIICPPTRDRSIGDLIAPLLTWTLGDQMNAARIIITANHKSLSLDRITEIIGIEPTWWSLKGQDYEDGIGIRDVTTWSISIETDDPNTSLTELIDKYIQNFAKLKANGAKLIINFQIQHQAFNDYNLINPATMKKLYDQHFEIMFTWQPH